MIRNHTPIAICLAGLIIMSALPYGNSLAVESNVIRVLFIFSWHRDMPWQIEVETGFKDHLKKRDKKPILYYEYMDAGRFKSQRQIEIFQNYLSDKYTDYQLDYVIYESFAAARFFRTYPNLFPNAKKLIINPGFALKDYHGDEPIIIPVNADYEGAARYVANANQGKTIYLVAGNTQAGIERIRKMKTIFSKIAPKPKVVTLAGLPFDQLLNRVTSLESDGVILYLLMFQDGAGKRFIPFDVARQISQKANVPVYSLWTSLIGSGIVGGYLLSGNLVGKEVANLIMAPKAMRGAEIINMSDKFHGFFFDWNQLKRWGIRENSLPANSQILFKPPSFIQRYSHQIIFFFLVAIILLYVIWNRRLNREIIERKRVEKKLVENETKYRSLSGATYEGIILIENFIIIEANQTIVTMFGYSDPADIIGKPVLDFVYPDDRQEVSTKISIGYKKSYEVRGQKKDGSVFPIEARGRMFTYKGKHVRVTAIRDLTEKKEAEEEIKQLKGILPICMHCKGIRDDHGYWNQLEKYITEHSEAEFSHGICDKCLAKYYPEIKK